MQEKETEISSLFEKKSAILSMTSFAIEVSSLFQCIKDQYFSYPLQVDPCTYCKHITGIEQARFFFQCYSSNTDLMNNSSDFTACCGVMKFTPISDLRRAFLTVFSGWVCLSQLLEKFSEWETEKANSISICIIW